MRLTSACNKLAKPIELLISFVWLFTLFESFLEACLSFIKLISYLNVFKRSAHPAGPEEAPAARGWQCYSARWKIEVKARRKHNATHATSTTRANPHAPALRSPLQREALAHHNTRHSRDKT